MAPTPDGWSPWKYHGWGWKAAFLPADAPAGPRQYKDILYVQKLQPLKPAVLPIFQFDKAYFDC
jgi:hypothetical protein